MILNTGIFDLAKEWGKLVSQAVSVHGDDGSIVWLRHSSVIDKNLAGQPNLLFEQFIRLIANQLIVGRVERTPRLDEPHERYAQDVLFSIEYFAIAHEYAHVILRHTLPTTNEQEFEADKLGYRIVKEVYRAQPERAVFEMSGATLYFAFEHTLCLSLGALNSGEVHPYPTGLSHPTPLSRLRKVRDYVRFEQCEGLGEPCLLEAGRVLEETKNLEHLFEIVAPITFQYMKKQHKSQIKPNIRWRSLAAQCSGGNAAQP